jgi:5-formyltetrahydrofolate cyclo-ligase
MTDKAALRKILQQRRTALDPVASCIKSRRIAAHILKCYGSGRTYLLYHPIRGEVDILPLARRLSASGNPPAFPAIEGGVMRFRLVQDLASDFTVHVAGIPQPGSHCPPVPERGESAILLVPGLGFTRTGFRIGYGGGCFDRFLEQFSGLSIGVCFSTQLAATLPLENHDLPVQRLCTETGFINCDSQQLPEVPHEQIQL